MGWTSAALALCLKGIKEYECYIPPQPLCCVTCGSPCARNHTISAISQHRAIANGGSQQFRTHCGTHRGRICWHSECQQLSSGQRRTQCDRQRLGECSEWGWCRR